MLPNSVTLRERMRPWESEMKLALPARHSEGAHATVRVRNKIKEEKISDFKEIWKYRFGVGTKLTKLTKFTKFTKLTKFPNLPNLPNKLTLLIAKQLWT